MVRILVSTSVNKKTSVVKEAGRIWINLDYFNYLVVKMLIKNITVNIDLLVASFYSFVCTNMQKKTKNILIGYLKQSSSTEFKKKFNFSFKFWMELHGYFISSSRAISNTVSQQRNTFRIFVKILMKNKIKQKINFYALICKHYHFSCNYNIILFKFDFIIL